ncbi:MAG: hypothetical protein ACYSWS_12250 [Planctomycetota bacterium]
MSNKKYIISVNICALILCLIVGLFGVSDVFANQPCFKCCGSGIWHIDNKMRCSGKSCKYCVKCNGCNGSGQISDHAKRCKECKGLGQIHTKGKKVCTGAGCKYCSPCKECKTMGWK